MMRQRGSGLKKVRRKPDQPAVNVGGKEIGSSREKIGGTKQHISTKVLSEKITPIVAEGTPDHISVLWGLGRYEEALHEIDAQLPIAERTFGTEHPKTLAARCMRAIVFGGLGRYKEALHEFEVQLPIAERTFGTEHPETLAARCMQAVVFSGLGCYEEALHELEVQLPIVERTFGTEHPETLAAHSLRVVVLQYLGRYEEARQEFEVQSFIARRTFDTDDDHTFCMRFLNARVFDLFRYKKTVEEPNARTTQLKNGLPLPDGDVLGGNETTPMEGPLSRKKQTVNPSDAKAETTQPTHPAQSIVEAKREATRLRVAALRANKKSHNIGLTNDQNEKLKAIAAANGKNVQAYLEDLVAENITANEHLVPVGKKRLLQGGAPKRVRSKQLAEENAHLRAELAKLKPA